jgi:hypothetical protein
MFERLFRYWKRIEPFVGTFFDDSELSELQIKCIHENCSYLPIRVKRPTFAGEIEDYILNKAQGVLPASQFQDLFDFDNDSDFVETGGILDYSEDRGLVEIAFSKPDVNRVKEEIKLLDGRIVDKTVWIEMGRPHFFWRKKMSSVEKRFYPQQFLGVENIINWHTHPGSQVMLGLSDVKTMNLMVEHMFPSQHYFMVLFNPSLLKYSWFQHRKV